MSQRTRLSRILVVEDHPENLCTIVDLLTTEGYEVIGCSTVLEALKHSKTQDFGVAFVDFQLPGPEGIQLLEQLKQSNRAIRIIINTRSELFNSAKDVVNIEPFAYIEMANDAGELLRQVDRAMRSQLDQYARELEEAFAERTVSLREREEQFRQLAENIREVFWLSSADKRQMFYVSPAYETIWGRSCASLYERPTSFLEAVHPDDRNRLIDALPKQLQGTFSEEYRIIRPDGTIRWIWARAFPIRNEQSEVYRIAGILEDMTERKQAEEAIKHGERRLWQSNKMEAIGTLAGGIAHDFNNILTAILGYTELALASVPKRSRTQRNLQEVLTAGHRAKHLVQQILTFSRQSGPERTAIKMAEIVKEAYKLLRAMLF